MLKQKNYNTRKKLIQYILFSFIFLSVAGLLFYKHKQETQKAFFDYYLGVFCADVDSGSIPETGEENE